MLDLTGLSGTQKKGKISKKKLLDKAVLSLVVFNQAEEILAVSTAEGAPRLAVRATAALHGQERERGKGGGRERILMVKQKSESIFQTYVKEKQKIIHPEYLKT